MFSVLWTSSPSSGDWMGKFVLSFCLAEGCLMRWRKRKGEMDEWMAVVEVFLCVLTFDKNGKISSTQTTHFLFQFFFFIPSTRFSHPRCKVLHSLLFSYNFNPISCRGATTKELDLLEWVHCKRGEIKITARKLMWNVQKSCSDSILFELCHAHVNELEREITTEFPNFSAAASAVS